MAWQDREEEHKIVMETQQKLGEVCMIWSAIEHQTVEIIELLVNTGPGQAAAISSGIKDMSSRLTFIEHLSEIISINDDWKKWIFSVLRFIKNNLGPKRNEYIHGYWIINNQNMIKISHKAKLERPQSNQSMKFVFKKEVEVSLETLDQWCQASYKCVEALSSVVEDLHQWHLCKRQPTAHIRYKDVANLK